MEQDKYSEALERAKAWLEGTLSPETTLPREVIELIFPELAESEDERIRKELVQYLKDYPNIPTGQYSKSDFYAYLEKQKNRMAPIYENQEAFEKALDKAWEFYNSSGSSIVDGCEDNAIELAFAKGFREGYLFGIEKQKEIPMPSSTELIELWNKEKTMLEEKDFRGDEWRLAYTAYMDGFAEGACVKRKQKEQKPAEKTIIKGGDFITDGERVFLVLANVAERNLGETYSTFCGSLILGVDGSVYCDNHDLKGFRLAADEERAKFIHDLKVRVDIKKKPAEWSEEDTLYLNVCKNALLLYDKTHHWDAYTIYSWLEKRLKSLRPQRHKWYIKKGHWYMCIVDKPEYGWTKGKVYQSPVDNLVETDYGGMLTCWPENEPWFRPATQSEIPSPQPQWKPSEEQMEDEKQNYSGLTDFEQAIHRGFLCAGMENVPVTIIKETAQDCLSHIEKPAKWSEEDEKMLRNCIDALEEGANGKPIVIDYGKHEKWLESLPSRFAITNFKQEWSEEDKKMLDNVIDTISDVILECDCDDVGTKARFALEKERDWLKSLCPQPRWKPTEEQMEALDTVYKTHGANNDVRRVIFNLMKDLKKLI